MAEMTKTTYVRRPDLVAANLGDELAVLDMSKSAYLGFNATAAQVWRLLQEPRSLDELCAALNAEFDVDAQRCRQEVEALLQKLQSAGMIRISDGTMA